jgi:hypothetical protein
MANGHAFDIGDGVERAGLEMAGPETDIAQSRAGRLVHRAITFAECRQGGTGAACEKPCSDLTLA